MAIGNTVSIDFWSTFLDSIGVFDCRLPGVFFVIVAMLLIDYSATVIAWVFFFSVLLTVCRGPSQNYI